MLESVFGLVKKSRLDAAEKSVDEAISMADEYAARLVELNRKNTSLLFSVEDQSKLISALRRDALTAEQEYSRVCAKVVELSDRVRDLTEKLDQLQQGQQAEKVAPVAGVQRKQFRGRPTSRMTATDFVERFAGDGRIRPEQLGMAASRLARARGIALSRITAKGADGVERTMNIYPTHLLREASGVQ